MKNTSPNYANFGQRFIALFIDNLLLAIVLSPIFMMLFEQPQYTNEQAEEILRTQGITGLINPTEIMIQQLVVLIIVAFFWIKFSATPGKRLLGLQVLDAKTLRPLTPMQATVRYLGYFISTLPFGLGFLWIIFDPKRQAWHDKLAHSVVISNKPQTQQPTPQQQATIIEKKSDDDNIFTA